MARPSAAARRYAEAAFQLATRDGQLDQWADGLAFAAQVLSDPRVLPSVDNPARPLAQRREMIAKLLGGRVPDSVIRLANLLAQRGSVDRIAQVSSEYRRLLDRHRGIVEARVTSAQPLSPDETEAVRQWVTKRTGKNVNLSANVDEGLIGGLTVRVGDTLLDASVRGRLERLRAQLVASGRIS